MDMQSEKVVPAKIFCAWNALNTGLHSIGNGGWGVSGPTYRRKNPSGKRTQWGVEGVWKGYYRGITY